MPDHLIEADDLFVYGPSYDQWARGWLFEGKSLGSVSASDLALAKAVYTSQKPLASMAHHRTVSLTTARANLARRVEKLSDGMQAALALFTQPKAKMTAKAFKQQMREQQQDAMKFAFEQGLYAAGRRLTRTLAHGDSKYLDSAMKEEMGYFEKFLDAVVSDSGTMPYDRRLRMYQDTLEAFFQSGRVLGMPDNTVIRWVGPVDGRKCKSCTYLVNNGPYTKQTLPTVPRAGMTLCRSNCRDRLLVSVVPYGEWQQIAGTQDQAAIRKKHYAALTRILRGGR